MKILIDLSKYKIVLLAIAFFSIFSIIGGVKVSAGIMRFCDKTGDIPPESGGCVSWLSGAEETIFLSTHPAPQYIYFNCFLNRGGFIPDPTARIHITGPAGFDQIINSYKGYLYLTVDGTYTGVCENSSSIGADNYENGSFYLPPGVKAKCNESCAVLECEPGLACLSGSGWTNLCRLISSPLDPACGACVASSPASPILNSPPNGSSVTLGSGNSVTLNFTLGSWGVGCPQTLSEKIYVFDNTAGVVVANNISIAPGSNSYTISGLAGGHTYSWAVTVGNGSYSSSSSMFSFTTLAAACTPTAPNAPTIVSPAFGATVTPDALNTVPLTAFIDSNWGNNCSQPNGGYSYFQYAPFGGSYTGSSNYTGSNTNITYNALVQGGTTYIWYAIRCNNSGLCAASAQGQFITTGGTTITSNGLTAADTCGNRASGRFGQANVTNPMQYGVNYQTPSGNAYQQAWLAFLPATGAYSENADTQIDSVVNGKVANSSSIAMRINLSNGYYYTINNSGSWDAGAAPADHPNQSNTAVMMAGSAASTSGAGNLNMTSSFRVKFNNNFPSGRYNIYVAAIITNSGGQTVSSYNNCGSLICYKKIDTWDVDMVNPSVSIVSSGGTGGNFSINWGFSDANTGIGTVTSRLWADKAGASLRDNTIGVTFNPVGTSQATATNPQVTGSTVRSYTDQNIPLNAAFFFDATATDKACNSYTPSPTIASSIKSWIISYNGSISGNGGIQGYSIPALNNFTVPFTSDVGIPYLSTYSALSGTADIPSDRQSKMRTYSANYINQAVNPPIEAGFNSSLTPWYDYLLDRVTKNAKTVEIAAPSGSTVSNTVSSYLGLTQPFVPSGGAGIYNISTVVQIGTFARSAPYMGKGSDGNLIIVHGDSTSHINLERCSTPDCSSGWNKTTVVSGYPGWRMPIVIGSGGFPIFTTTDIKIISCQNIDCTTSFSSPVLPVTVRAIVSGALGTDGIPIFMVADGSSNYKVLKCNDSTCSNPAAYTYTSLVTGITAGSVININSDGFPMVAYGRLGPLSFLKCYNQSCTSNTVRDLGVSIANVYSIITNSDGTPGILYQAGSGGLGFYKCADVACSSGTGNTVETSLIAGRASVIIGTDNKPLIGTYTNDSKSVELIKCGNASCSSGNVKNIPTTVDLIWSEMSVGLKLTASGLPAVSFQNPNATGDIRFFVCSDQTCSSSVGTGSQTPASQNFKNYVLVNNLTINSGAWCDMQAMFFISGTLTVNPDFVTVGSSACAFFVKGDITINNGTQKTNAAMTSITLSDYDKVYGQFVTDSIFHTTLDNGPGIGNKWDGLYINGGVVAGSLDLKRDLNDNNAQPAHTFVYDPRYREIFKEDINFIHYSFREVGLMR